LYQQKIIVFFIVMITSVSCERSDDHEVETDNQQTEKPIRPIPDPAVIAAGKTVYKNHCLQCHGVNGVGNANWRIKKADGFWLPPPLNGTAHTWHHPKKWLFDRIKNGSPEGKGEMPALKDKLSDAEINAVIAWMQSLWPDNVYFMWLEKDQE